MPKKEQHLAIARHNEAFVASFDVATTSYRDWIVTGLFYAALHYVEAYFATQNYHSSDHRTRDTAIARFSETKKIYSDYSELKNHSINARYFGARFAEVDVTTNLLPCLNNIKGHLLPLT